MKRIETKGITCLEILREGEAWYCGTDYASGDLYEAEEIYAETGTVRPNRLIFVHHPDGAVYEPALLEAGQYFGRPVFVAEKIYILLVDFRKKLIQILECDTATVEVRNTIELPLTSVKDCYNLRLAGDPLMITRQGAEGGFEIIYPAYRAYETEANEAFLYREGERLYFSVWYEDPDYREEVIVRDIATGEVVERLRGSVFITPSGEGWVLG